MRGEKTSLIINIVKVAYVSPAMMNDHNIDVLRYFVNWS